MFDMLRYLFLVTAILFAGVGNLWAVPVEVGELDRLAFEQRKASAHMNELEERMYLLSELLRDTEPDHAARLMLGLEKSRADLIVARMDQIRRHLLERRLDPAVSEEAQVRNSLEALRDLLLSTDLDLMLKLDRLRKLNEALQKLDRILTQERRAHGIAGAFCEFLAQGEVPEPGKFDQLRNDEDRNRKSTDSLRVDVRRSVQGDSAAPGHLGAASKSMAGAGKCCAARDAPGAAKQQEQAIEALEKARQALEDERQELLDELRGQVRAMVLQAIRDMLQKQTRIREANEALGAALSGGDPEAVFGIKRLGAAEQGLVDIANQTIRLINETEFGIALPLAIRSVERRVSEVAGELKAGRGGASVVASERRIEKDLSDLLALLKEQDSAARQGGGGGGQGQPDRKEQKERNKLRAELEMLRLLQIEVNRGTRQVETERGDDGRLSDELARIVRDVQDLQAEIQDATERLLESVKRQRGRER